MIKEKKTTLRQLLNIAFVCYSNSITYKIIDYLFGEAKNIQELCKTVMELYAEIYIK
jgi:hypothetical protein